MPYLTFIESMEQASYLTFPPKKRSTAPQRYGKSRYSNAFAPGCFIKLIIIAFLSDVWLIDVCFNLQFGICGAQSDIHKVAPYLICETNLTVHEAKG